MQQLQKKRLDLHESNNWLEVILLQNKQLLAVS